MNFRVHTRLFYENSSLMIVLAKGVAMVFVGRLTKTIASFCKQSKFTFYLDKIFFSPEDLRSRDLRTPHVCLCVCLWVCVSVTKDLKSCHATSHLFGNFMQEMALVFRTITAPIDR